MVRPRIPLPENGDREEVAKVYSKVASQCYRGYRFWARKALGRILFKEGRVLAISSDSGYLLIEMAKIASHFELYGLDSSLAMLKLAQENIRKAGYASQVNLAKGSACKIPFDDSFFDLVISANALHRIDNLEAFFGEAYRVLKVDGFLRVHAWRRNAWPIVLKLASWQQKHLINSPLAGPKTIFDASYTPREVKKVLTKIPFRRVTIRAPMAALTIIARK